MNCYIKFKSSAENLKFSLIIECTNLPIAYTSLLDLEQMNINFFLQSLTCDNCLKTVNADGSRRGRQRKAKLELLSTMTRPRSAET